MGDAALSRQRITASDLKSIGGLPILLDVEMNGLNAVNWAEEYQQDIQSLIKINGAVLIRGLKVPGSAQFGKILSTLFGSELLEYTYRSTPRTHALARVRQRPADRRNRARARSPEFRPPCAACAASGPPLQGSLVRTRATRADPDASVASAASKGSAGESLVRYPSECRHGPCSRANPPRNLFHPAPSRIGVGHPPSQGHSDDTDPRVPVQSRMKDASVDENCAAHRARTDS